eukprot:GILJ01004673.1.p1 GENE.GILJ01004673.1~~GILJ01004673.1.p1  ORF type:complete len:218 (-),score=1.51 GILJ01004673.1:246-899(-)
MGQHQSVFPTSTDTKIIIPCSRYLWLFHRFPREYPVQLQGKIGYSDWTHIIDDLNSELRKAPIFLVFFHLLVIIMFVSFHLSSHWSIMLTIFFAFIALVVSYYYWTKRVWKRVKHKVVNVNDIYLGMGVSWRLCSYRPGASSAPERSSFLSSMIDKKSSIWDYNWLEISRLEWATMSPEQQYAPPSPHAIQLPAPIITQSAEYSQLIPGGAGTQDPL